VCHQYVHLFSNLFLYLVIYSFFANLFSVYLQVAYYGEPSMAPEIFIQAYARATPEEYQLSEEAPKIDAQNPAGTKMTLLPLFVCHGPTLIIRAYYFENVDTIMDLLNCSQARRAILDYYQTSGEPQAVQEAIKTSQEHASKTVTMETMSRM